MEMVEMKIKGRLVDIHQRQIYPASIEIAGGKILGIEKLPDGDGPFLMPGFIDAHVHIESSMLVPSEFARLAVVHGTVATISDPHEIGNVLGVDGVEYMIENGRKVPFKFFFGAPSCVPATPFETAGAEITPRDIDFLMARPEIKYLSEMMNWPGVLHRDAEVMEKIAIAHKHLKPVDGHAPGLHGQQAKEYIDAGISTDHECFTLDEALDKLKHGMKIAIREGSAAKNFEALYPLLHDFHDQIMLFSDDKHPDNLVEGHINQLVKRAVDCGVDMFKVLQAACLNPIAHYNLEVGQLRVGDAADFILLDNLEDWKPIATYIGGKKVAENDLSFIPSVEAVPINNFIEHRLKPADFAIEAKSKQIHVIEAMDGQLITNDIVMTAKIENDYAVSDTENDVLKFAVINRYAHAKPGLGFIRNIGLKRGAIASSVGHDSHNVLVLGVDDESMARAANRVFEAKGGISAVDGSEESILPLPIAGLMSAVDGYQVAEAYAALDKRAKEMGSTLQSPYMTLSFMALLVIPALKLSDKGLFDGENFAFKSLFEQKAD
jgi:adenine deaminase